MMKESSIKKLLQELKNSNEVIREQATSELWRIWFHQKGILGLEMLRRSQALIDSGNYHQAEEMLTELISTQSDFAEAWNRRAVLYYIIKEYQKALTDCQQVLELNPVHFGALHGLGLCYAALGRYREAIKAFRQALEIQPYALVNQRLILECTAKLT